MGIRKPYLLFWPFYYILAAEGDESKADRGRILLPTIINIFAVSVVKLLQVINILPVFNADVNQQCCDTAEVSYQ